MTQIFAPPDEPSSIDMIHSDPEFAELRRRLRRFVLPVAAGFMGWYMVFVLLSAYAHDLVATPVFGSVNLGVVLGLAQFVTTAGITWAYNRFAGRRLDPLVASLKERAGVGR